MPEMFLKGKVIELRHGQVITEVVIQTDCGTEIVSVITNSSAARDWNFR